MGNSLHELASTWMQFQDEIADFNVRLQTLETAASITVGDLPGFQILPNSLENMMLNLNNVEAAIENFEDRLDALGA